MKYGLLSKAVGAMLLASTVVAGATEMRIAIASDPDALDPATTGTLAARQVFATMCDKLINIDKDVKFVPGLATEWKWSDDMMHLTLKLREGVTFQDGEPFNAEAVVYNINRDKTLPGSNRASEISMIGSAEAVDEYTVRINLPEPSVPLLAALAQTSGIMVSPKAADAAGEKFADHPVCAGPYKFVERIPQDRIVLEKYNDYWDAAAYHVDKVVYLPITDATVRLSNLRSGDVDIIERVSPSDLQVIKQDGNVRVESITGLGSYYVVINFAGGDGSQTNNPLSKDARVREALELSIDREAMNQVANDGVFTVGNQPVPPNNPYYIKEFPVPPRDIDKARKLIEEASGGKGVSFTLLLPNLPAYRKYAEIIQSMAAEANINIKLEMQETTTALANWANGNFQAFLIRWSGRADPDGNIYSFKACNGNRNGSKYCNEKVDHWLDESRRRSDPAARYEAFKNAAEQYLADRPYIYLFHPTELTGLRKEVTGFTAVPDGLIRLRDVQKGE